MTLSLLLFICACVGTVLSQTVQVDTQYGPVLGETVPVSDGVTSVTVDAFKGIPFAKDTSGARRFLNPEAPDPWVAVRDALEPGPACPQTTGLLNASNPNWNQLSEDCLHMDIYTPDALAGPNSYPVMVYIYGGGYSSGANIQYPGHFLARHGVIVAVLNYRLGKFGFTYTGNAASPGNVGLWDQRMGLQFVVNNIANFGGDPNRITVFGQSAGAGSTGLFLVSPQTKDLFQQAMLQSGNEMNLWTWNRPESDPQNYTYQIAEDLDCLAADDFQMMDCLRTKTVDEIIANSSSRCTPGYICLGMAPVIDGPGGFLPKNPKELRQDGDIMTGPIISGLTQDDGAMFAAAFVPGTLVGCCNRTRFEEILRDRIVGFFGPRFDELTEDAIFEALNWHYTYWPYLYENELNRDSYIRLITDAAFGAPWDWQIKKHSAISDVFSYIFDYRSTNSSLEDWVGVTHSADTPYVWGHPMLQYNEHIRDGSYLADDPYNAADVTFSLYYQELITNFVKYGDPTFNDVQKPSGGSTVWPKFDELDYSTFYLSNDAQDPMTEYRQRDYMFWLDYMKYVMYDIRSGEDEDTDDFDVLSGIQSPVPLLDVLSMPGYDEQRFEELREQYRDSY